MVNVYGNYSETGYNNPYAGNTPAPAATAAQADLNNVVGWRNRAAIGSNTLYGNTKQDLENKVLKIGNPHPVGSQLWYQTEIANREATARSNTIITPIRQYSPEPIGAPRDYFMRSDIVKPTDLGDIRTQQLITGGYTPEQALTIQRNESKDSRSASYYENELQKALQSNISKSSGYHAWARDTGLPQSPNPYEYVADLSLFTLKGTQGKDAKFSPVRGDILGLPGGQGIQDIAWSRAVARDRNQPLPAYGNFSQAIDTISSAKANRQMGPYGQLSSFSSGQGTLTLAKQQEIGYKAGQSAGWMVRPDLQASNPAASDYQPFGNFRKISDNTINNIQSPQNGEAYWTVNRVPVEKNPTTFNGMKITSLELAPKQGLIAAPFPSNDSIISGFDTFQTKTSNKIYGGLGTMFGVTPEQAKQSVYMADTRARLNANINPTPTNLAASFGTGMVKDTLDKPVEGAAMLGVAYLGGYAFKGVEMVGVAAAPKVVAYSPKLAKAGSLLWKATPYVMTGLYGENVASRSTEQYTNFKPGNISSNLGGISATEAIPMSVGLNLGYNRNPQKDYFVIKSKATDTGLKLKNVKTNIQWQNAVESLKYNQPGKIKSTLNEPTPLGPNELEIYSGPGGRAQTILMEKPKVSASSLNYQKTTSAWKKSITKSKVVPTQPISDLQLSYANPKLETKVWLAPKITTKQPEIQQLALAQTTMQRIKPLEITKTTTKQPSIQQLALAQTTMQRTKITTKQPEIQQLALAQTTMQRIKPLEITKTIQKTDWSDFGYKPKGPTPTIVTFSGITSDFGYKPKKPTPKPIIKTPVVPTFPSFKPKVWKPVPKTPKPYIPRTPAPKTPKIFTLPPIKSFNNNVRIRSSKAFFGFREIVPTWTPEEQASGLFKGSYGKPRVSKLRNPITGSRLRKIRMPKL